MIARIRKELEALGDRPVQWRRWMHQHPELSFHEEGTAAHVASVLREEGIPVREGLARHPDRSGGTGLIALVTGSRSPSDRCFALRADMDALPIQEVGKAGYCSLNPGVMHACGHDAHTAMVLAAGIALHRMREAWSGTVMLVFQPGEEKEPGGASLFVKEGALTDPPPSGILGQHVTPELASGKLGFRSGPFMAAADELYLIVRGRGGHASKRAELVDPILIASRMLPVLYEAAERAKPSGEPMVMSFGRFIAHGATNIVPDEARLDGTLRTFNEDLRALLHDLLPRVCAGVAQDMGGEAELRIVKGSPVVKNDPALTARMRRVAEDLVGAENVVDMDIRMGAEDFAYYTHVMPGCFFRLGTGNPAKPGTQSGLHTAAFDIDEDALPIGAAMMMAGALNELQ
ncbi:MAG TPA: M20 family metallopeptidase [Flavobacteriales bacterium]|nr:M20 family metallopeptidase [Flavobacteriales bacterium]HMR26310.1 M20 family metallopeptidase [Flavobacteriales bacterium]